MPRLSVLLPVKDGERYLPRAMRSTLSALPADAELVVVDDGSRDGTAAILADAADRDARVRVLTNPEAGGVAAALNLALDRTDSQYVGRMDADDVALRRRFATQVRALRDADFVFGSSVLLDPDGRPTGISSPLPIRPVAARYHLLVGNYFSHPTLCCRREALETAGRYRPVVVEDFDLWLRASAAGLRLRQLALPAIGYRMHAGQVTKQWRPDPTDEILDHAYRALLPDELHDIAPVLRHSAVLRRRDGAQESGAWARLRSWLLLQSQTLGAVDRVMLRRRVASITPRT